MKKKLHPMLNKHKQVPNPTKTNRQRLAEQLAHCRSRIECWQERATTAWRDRLVAEQQRILTTAQARIEEVEKQHAEAAEVLNDLFRQRRALQQEVVVLRNADTIRRFAALASKAAELQSALDEVNEQIDQRTKAATDAEV